MINIRINSLITVFLCLAFDSIYAQRPENLHTEITEWQYGKAGALSLTYDDGSINQFRRALPIMQRLQLPATFFVITGGIPGSVYHGKFIGRPVKTIIAESASVPTGSANFFERCSAGGYLGYKGTISYVTKAAGMFDSGKKEAAFKLIDDLYQKVRSGGFEPGYQPCDEVLQENGLTWPDLRGYAKQGYEIASHSITHASMPALDAANIIYELEKSKDEIRQKMGERYTFSAEVPYGYEDSRVMKYAYKIYPALRNRMPEPWLKEIDRASKKTPGAADHNYIQWQRGATTKTPLNSMKNWVDTAVSRKDTWLVLVFHGVDSLGYEALNHQLLDEYFQYIKNKNDKLWIATFGDVAKYMREKQSANITEVRRNNTISVQLSHSLNRGQYDLPLTLKTYLPENWKKVIITEGDVIIPAKIQMDDKGAYVQYQAKPNGLSLKIIKN